MQTREDTYGTIAGYYEKALGKRLAPLRGNIRTFINYKGHTRILDLCCGTGQQLQMLAAPGMKLWGIDSSPAMLNQADRSRGVSYILGDAASIPCRKQSFDAVILTLALHEKSVGQRQEILRQGWDCLRPEGHLILADFCRPQSTVSGWITSRIMLPIIERLAGRQHFAHYRSWMESGALESVIAGFSGRKNLISSHFSGTVAVCSLEKEAYDKNVFLSLNKPIG